MQDLNFLGIFPFGGYPPKGNYPSNPCTNN
jgi:hypothetical protein